MQGGSGIFGSGAAGGGRPPSQGMGGFGQGINQHAATNQQR